MPYILPMLEQINKVSHILDMAIDLVNAFLSNFIRNNSHSLETDNSIYV